MSLRPLFPSGLLFPSPSRLFFPSGLRLLHAVPLLFLWALLLPGQVVLTSGPIASSGGSGDKDLVRDSQGNLYCLSVRDDGAGNRPLLLQASTDGGSTWFTVPVTLNDTSSGLTGANPTNQCTLAIDGQGVLHVVWGRYYYPSFYAQYYRSYDPIAGAASPIVSVSAITGATATDRTSAMAVRVDQNDTVWIGAHGATSWRTQLLMSDQPQAANQAFTDLGPVSTTASAQSVRLAVDVLGSIHCSYYRNTGAGEYWHRIYVPATGWSASSRLGNTAPTNDFYGTLCSDLLGNVHALYVMDASAAGPVWQFRYRRLDPATGWGPEVTLFDATPSQYTGIANYKAFALACEETTGTVVALFRDLSQGGALTVALKDLAASSFTTVGALAPPTTGLHAYANPCIRGSLMPPFNNTGGDLDLSWRANPSPGPYDLTFAHVGSGPPPATLVLTGPATVGTATALDLDSPSDPNGSFACGFSTGTSPGILLTDGRTIPLNADFLFALCFTPGNGIFIGNVGTLDPNGQGSVVIAVPNIPALLNATFHAAFVVADPTAISGVGTLSPSLAITIQ